MRISLYGEENGKDVLNIQTRKKLKTVDERLFLSPCRYLLGNEEASEDIQISWSIEKGDRR